MNIRQSNTLYRSINIRAIGLLTSKKFVSKSGFSQTPAQYLMDETASMRKSMVA